MGAFKNDAAVRLEPGRRVTHSQAGAATLARGLALLETFQGTLRPLTHGELAELSGLTPPTVTRLASALEKLGYLHRRQDRRWELTADVLSLGYPKLAGSRLRRFAHPYLVEIARLADVTVGITEASGTSMVYIETCTVSATAAVRLDVGARLDMATSTAGQAYLASVEGEDSVRLCGALRRRNKKAWRGVSRAIDAARAALDQKGFVYADGDGASDTRVVAAPLVPDNSERIFVVDCSAPRFAVSESRMLDELGPRLVVLCRHLRELP